MQFLSQHVTYHGRTQFTDDAASGACRVLPRIWLTGAFTRMLPEGLAIQWGDTRSGALRIARRRAGARAWPSRTERAGAGKDQ